MPGRALVFLGFMGAGKSAAARDLAAVMGTRALDTDRLLEERLGHTIEEEFDRRGEASFREHEEALCVELLERAGGGDVIALGGGAVLSQRTREALARHVAILLEVDVEEAWRRASGGGVWPRRPGGARPRPVATLPGVDAEGAGRRGSGRAPPRPRAPAPSARRYAERDALSRSTPPAALPASARRVARRALPHLR